jgi:DASS family divalent anion:Na+ symporter
MSKDLRNALIIIAVGLVIWFIPVPAGLKPQAWHLFAIFVATILGFILQPVPLGAVALISITITPLLGVLKPAEVLSGFSASPIWLTVAAFLYAKGFIKTGFGRRIAYTLIGRIGDSTLKLGYCFSLTDLILAPATPSNTARVGGILYPIARSVSSAFESEPGPTSRRMGAFLMQSLYHGNAITSAMFMTAMTANPLIVSFAAKTANVTLTWGSWALAAVVPGVASLIIIPYFLYKFFPPEIKHTPMAKEIAKAELSKMGPMSNAEKVVAGVFIGALLLWATGQYTGIDALVVALLGVCVMIVSKVIDWKDVLDEKGAWDTLLWMGSIVALADYLLKTGFIPWFAKSVSAAMVGIDWVFTLLALVIIYMYSHYGFASLVAHVTAMYAAFVSVAIAAGAPPVLAVLSIGFTANLCMSLTHYAAGPAPILFGAGFMTQGTWWKLGFIISVINLLIWVGLGSFWWKILGLW